MQSEPKTGGHTDLQTGRLVKEDDTINVTDDVTKKLTERQRLIYEMLPVGDIQPKVFFKYFYVNTATGEKSGDVLVQGAFASEQSRIPD